MSKVEVIQSILREFFDNDAITIDDNTVAADIEGWDSLANVQIMVAIESEFGVTFDLDELASFKKIGDIVNCLESKV